MEAGGTFELGFCWRPCSSACRTGWLTGKPNWLRAGEETIVGRRITPAAPDPTSQRNRLIHNRVAMSRLQPGFRSDIDREPEEVLQVGLEPSQIEQGSPRRQPDQEIHIAVRTEIAARNAADKANPLGAPSVGDPPDFFLAVKNEMGQRNHLPFPLNIAKSSLSRHNRHYRTWDGSHMAMVRSGGPNPPLPLLLTP